MAGRCGLAGIPFAARAKAMDLFNLFAGLLTLSALFSYVNHRWLRLPATIGMMVAALAFSLALVLAGNVWPGVKDYAEAAVEHVPLDRALLHGMLGFLLFAGALHLDVGELWSQRVAIATLATAGVIISTVVVGLLGWCVLRFVGLRMPLIYCFLFGALISPTDPLAVLSILKQLAPPKSWETIICGESLFNDGVGVVVFIGLLGVADRAEEFSFPHLAALFAREALGGLVFGLVIGWLAYRLLKSIDQYQVEVMITLALVAGGYALAEALGVSGPLAMVVAGLFIGSRGRALAMSETTRHRLDVFWELIDDILNAVLFVLVGLELVTLKFTGQLLLAGLAMVPVVLLARLVSLSVPLGLLSYWQRVSRATVYVLTWGGLRGGISLALALALHGRLVATSVPDIVLPMTYVVVVFSVVVQGLTVGRVISRAMVAEGAAPPIDEKSG